MLKIFTSEWHRFGFTVPFIILSEFYIWVCVHSIQLAFLKSLVKWSRSLFLIKEFAGIDLIFLNIEGFFLFLLELFIFYRKLFILSKLSNVLGTYICTYIVHNILSFFKVSAIFVIVILFLWLILFMCPLHPYKS